MFFFGRLGNRTGGRGLPRAGNETQKVALEDETQHQKDEDAADSETAAETAEPLAATIFDIGTGTSRSPAHEATTPAPMARLTRVGGSS